MPEASVFGASYAIGEFDVQFRDRVLVSLSFIEPCSVARLWKVLCRDLTADRIGREEVYRILYQAKQDGLVSHRIRATYELTERGRSRVKSLLNVPTLFRRRKGFHMGQQFNIPCELTIIPGGSSTMANKVILKANGETVLEEYEHSLDDGHKDLIKQIAEAHARVLSKWASA